MLNEFFCWLIGHQSFAGAKGVKLYKRDSRRFVYRGIKIYPCKCCNKLFTKWDAEIPNPFPEIEDRDVPPMPLTEGKQKSNIKKPNGWQPPRIRGCC